MKTVLHIPGTKKPQECNVLVGTNEVLVQFAERCLGLKAQHVPSLTDAQVRPGLFQVDTESAIHITQDKILAKVGIWDASQPIEPGSLVLKEIVEEAARMVGVKLDKDAVVAAQWKLLEGSGEVSDIHKAIMEATQWVQIPPSPKPELPWFNSEGFFRLPQIDRELRSYRAFQEGKEGAKETRLVKLKPSEDKIKASELAMKGWRLGWWGDATTRVLLSCVWKRGSAKKSSK